MKELSAVRVRRKWLVAVAAMVALVLGAALAERVPRPISDAVAPTARAAGADVEPPAHRPHAEPSTAPITPVTPDAPSSRVPHRGTVYLTFDDGPDPRWTPQVLDILRRHGIKAVFFEVGSSVAAHPDLVRRVRREGHLIGNHTWSHASLTALRGRAIRSQLDRTERALGERPRCVRPPYGAHDARVDKVIRSRGQRVMLWSVDPQDWARPGVDRIVRRVLRQVEPGARILMHDGGGDRSQTVAALERVIVRLQARGYRFGLLDC